MLLKGFGDFLFGWFCSSFAQLKEKYAGTELEGFALEVDFQSKSVLGQTRKTLLEDMGSDILSEDLRGYELVGYPEGEVDEQPDEAEERARIDALGAVVQNVDSRAS